MVWHSATKYLAGHSDVTAGVVVARDPGRDQKNAPRGYQPGSHAGPAR